MTAPVPAPAPRTAWMWTSHCSHCQWRVLTFGGQKVGTFPNPAAVQTYIEQHLGGPEK